MNTIKFTNPVTSHATTRPSPRLGRDVYCRIREVITVAGHIALISYAVDTLQSYAMQTDYASFLGSWVKVCGKALTSYLGFSVAAQDATHRTAFACKIVNTHNIQLESHATRTWIA
jgi:hypothetical protein